MGLVVGLCLHIIKQAPQNVTDKVGRPKLRRLVVHEGNLDTQSLEMTSSSSGFNALGPGVFCGLEGPFQKLECNERMFRTIPFRTFHVKLLLWPCWRTSPSRQHPKRRISPSTGNSETKFDSAWLFVYGLIIRDICPLILKTKCEIRRNLGVMKISGKWRAFEFLKIISEFSYRCGQSCDKVLPP